MKKNTHRHYRLGKCFIAFLDLKNVHLDNKLMVLLLLEAKIQTAVILLVAILKNSVFNAQTAL